MLIWRVKIFHRKSVQFLRMKRTRLIDSRSGHDIYGPGLGLLERQDTGHRKSNQKAERSPQTRSPPLVEYQNQIVQNDQSST